MAQRNIIKGAAVHLASISICLKPTTFLVEYTFESGRDLPKARDVMVLGRVRVIESVTPTGPVVETTMPTGTHMRMQKILVS